MRKLMLYSFIFLMAIAVVSASSVSRDMPARISPGEDISVTLSVSGAEAGKTFTLEDTVPSGWALKSWDVSGSQESKDKISHRFEDGTRHGWSFTASSTSPSITYVLSIPANAEQKSYSFKALWFDPSGFFNQESSTVVRSIRCGDGVCEGAENSDSCADCPKPPVTTATPPPEQGQVESEEEKGINPFLIVVLLLVIIAAFAAYFLFVRKKE